MASDRPASVANFSACIATAAATFAARPAIERLGDAGVETTTYADLRRMTGRFAAWFSGAGLLRGDRVAILADNDARWIAAYLGALHLGLVAVPLDTAYKPAQVRTILDSSGARLLLTSLRYHDTARTAARLDAAGGCALALLDGTADGFASPDLSARSGAIDPPLVDVAGGDAAVILYTSGTTADPKGVVLTHANLDAERLAAFGVIDANERDAVLGVLPLFHALAQMANLLLPLSIGARVVFLERVSSETLLQALQTRGITIFACVPQFFYIIHQRVMAEFDRRPAIVRALLKAIIRVNGRLRDGVRWNPGRRVFARVHRTLGSQMRVLITGGSRFDEAIGRDLYGMGFTLLNAYGLTETSGGATVTRPGDRFTTSVGQPLPGVEVRIAPREATVDGPADGPADGEILIRGPIVMREYFGRADSTAESIVDGWLHTGDLGRLDADGRVYITGRKKEIIVLSSGKNLYPEEIEAHYRTSAFITEICVLGLTRPGEPAAERLHAVIVPDDSALRERGVVNIRELIRFELEGLSVSLPPHKRILTYDIWLEPLPRTTTGKLKRPEIERRVRERAAAATASDAPLTDDDRAWLAVPERATLAAAIAERVTDVQVRPHSNLELDLGLDSMERVEVLTLLERRQGTRVAPEVRATIFTVRQLVDAVIAAPRASAGEPADPAATGDLPWDAVLSAPPDPAVVAPLRKPKRIRAAFFFVVLQIARVIARVWLGFRARGREHLPNDGPFLICPNHLAYLDGFFLAAALPARLLRQVFFVGAAEYFQTPAMRWWAEAVNIVPVDPDANLVTAMQAGATGLRLGKVLILFPEGERSIDGEVKRFKKGAAILASTLNVPIVPVALDGLFELWPRGRSVRWRALLPWRAPRVTLEFGPALTMARGQDESETARLRASVVSLRKASRPTPAL